MCRKQHFCCGSAGTYNLLQPDIAETLGRAQGGACRKHRSRHHRGRQSRLHGADRAAITPLPVVAHGVELLDWATGGPLPAALQGRDIARAAAQSRTRCPHSSIVAVGRRQVSGDAIEEVGMSGERDLRHSSAEIETALGADSVNRSEETIRRYGENTMPGGDQQARRRRLSRHRPRDVQAIVRAANKHTRAALSGIDRPEYRARLAARRRRAGQVDGRSRLRRMNRILRDRREARFRGGRAGRQLPVDL